MILRRLRVERFRQHNLPVEIVFDDRLTVVSGLNEAGKTTLFTALQYAFFRRSNAKGKDIDSLAPWDTHGLSTGVTVEFAHGGIEYRLEKTWGKRAATTLARRNAGGTFVPYMETGADEFLAGMFAGAPQRQGAFTGFNGQQLGLAYLLFVPQAAIAIARDAKDSALNSDARARLTEIVGAAAQSPQEARLCKRIVDDYDLLFNLKGERRKAKAVRSAGEEIAETEAAIAGARAAVSAFDELAGRLDAAKRSRDAAAQAARVAKEAAAAALPRYEAAVELDRKRAEAGRAHADAVAAYDALLEENERYERVTREAEKLGPQRAALAKSLLDAEALFENASAARADAAAAFALVCEPDPGLAALEREAAAARKAMKAREDFEKHNRRMSRVIARDERIREIDEAVEALGPASQAELKLLQSIVERGRAISCKLDAAMTSVAVIAESRVHVVWNAESESGEERLAAGERFDAKVSGELTFAIPGVASFEVRGPAADIADLRVEEALVAKELAVFERRVGTRDPFELQRRIVTSNALVRERKEKADERDALLAGDSRATIQSAIDKLRDRAAGAPDETRLTELETLVSERKAAYTEGSAAAAAAMNAASRREKLANDAARDARAKVAKADALHRDLDLALRALAQSFASHEDRKAALMAAFTAQFETKQRFEAATAAFAPYQTDREPLAVYAEFEAAATARAKEAHDAHIVVVQLQSEADSTYESAPAAKLVELEETLEGLRIRSEDERLSDNAMKLLRSFVDDAEQRRVERFGQPILDRVAPWFAAVTGRKLSGLDLDANNGLESLKLADVQRPVRFEELSQGTCDQLALLIRLAYASLLTAPDCLGPMPILLDDPLVNADAARRTRFHRVLENVSAGAQVVVFTCRPEDYADIQGRTTAIGTCDDRSEGTPPAAA